MTIHRRGRSHTARCACGWGGHAWNELRPAEADAWHHMYGEARIVDDSEQAVASTAAPPLTSRRPRGASAEALITRARELADGPSPYAGRAATELWHLAAEDPLTIHSAISEISELLWRHSRRSASTADSQWLQLITAKRLLQEALDKESARII